MRLLIHGYGRMGRLVAEVAGATDSIKQISSVDASARDAEYKNLKDAQLSNFDTIIDFSRADAVLPLLNEVAAATKPPAVVIATSGWNDERKKADDLVESKKLRVLYGANFALATALFMRISEYAAQLIDKAAGGEFDITVSETHHRAKADMPSGTAILLADKLVASVKSKKSVVHGNQKQQVAPEELQVASLRSGFNLGEHTVVFDSPAERLTFTQQTTDRKAYAQGAVDAAKWLVKQPAGKLYVFDDYLNEVLK